MTPDQIFKAETKLRELNKIDAAFVGFDNYVFSASVQLVEASPGSLAAYSSQLSRVVSPFPLGDSDLAVRLKETCKAWLTERKEALTVDLSKMGVELS